MNRFYFNTNIQIGITDRCNLYCYMCRPSLTKSRKKINENFWKDMDVNTFENIIKNLYKNNFENIMLCWVGEPLFHPEFKKIMNILYNYDIKRNFFKVLTFNTNATLFNKDITDFLIDLSKKWDKKIAIFFSLDAFSRESFYKIKGIDLWDRVFENVTYFFEAKKRAKLFGKLQASVQFLVTEYNIHEVEPFYDFFSQYFSNLKMNWELAFEVNFKMDNAIMFKETLMHPQKKYREIFLKAKELLKNKKRKEIFYNPVYKMELSLEVGNLRFYDMRDKKKPLFYYNNRPPCIAPFLYPTVHTNGNVTVCCRDNSFELLLGNLNEQLFEEIWNGDRAKKLREAHLNSDLTEYPLCFFCENYTEYFINDEIINKIYKKEFDYQKNPIELNKDELIKRLEKVFKKQPDLSKTNILLELYGDNTKKVVWLYETLFAVEKNVKIRELLVGAYFNNHDFKKILKIYENVSDENISNNERKIIIKTFIKLKEYEKALKFIKNLEYTYMLKLLLQVYKKLKDIDKQIEILNIILERVEDPKEYEDYYIELLVVKKRFIKAICYLRSRYKHGNPYFENKVCDIYEKAGKFYYAFKHLNKVANFKNFFRRAILLEKAKKFDRIIFLYENEKLEFNRYFFYRPYVSACWNTNNHKRAIWVFEKFFLKEKSLIFYEEAVRFFLKYSEYNKAKKCIKIILKKKKKMQYFMTMVYIYEKMNKKIAAILTCGKAIFYYPFSIDIYKFSFLKIYDLIFKR